MAETVLVVMKGAIRSARMLQFIHTMMAGVVFESYLSQYMLESHIRSAKTSPSSCGRMSKRKKDKGKTKFEL